jgi:hypothetical protein
MQKGETRPQSIIPVHLPPMTDCPDDDLSGACVREVEHAIVTDSDSPTVSIAKLLTAMWKRIIF